MKSITVLKADKGFIAWVGCSTSTRPR